MSFNFRVVVSVPIPVVVVVVVVVCRYCSHWCCVDADFGGVVLGAVTVIVLMLLCFSEVLPVVTFLAEIIVQFLVL